MQFFEFPVIFGGQKNMMFIEIDFNSDEAIYQQLCNQIIQGIATARIAQGDVLPSVRQLADEVGINMHTVNKAYSLLKQEGYVKVDRRKGAVISCSGQSKEEAKQVIRKEMAGILAQARCRGLTKEDIAELVDDIYNAFDEYDRVKEAGRPQA